MSTEIRPFILRIDDSDIDDLHRRLDSARWPDENPEAGWGDGLPLAYAREFARYWRETFDWRGQEERINAVPQFSAPVDGHDVHFFHVRSPRPEAKPLLLVHGYDTGAGVARDIGLRHPDRVAAIHTTGMLGGEDLIAETADMFDPEEARAVADGYRYQYEVGAYAMLQSTHPQSIAYALTDSPVAQMSWTVERFHDWSAAVGDPDEVLDRDEMLTVVSLYWFFRTGGSSARYYKYGLPNWAEPLEPSRVPTAILVMADDIGRPVRRLVEKTDHVIHWTQAERGGHFAAWEQPALVADDIRASIGDLA